MGSYGVGKVTATLNRIRRLCDDQGRIVEPRLREIQRRWWSEHLWAPVAHVRLFFRHGLTDPDVRRHDARIVRETGVRLPLGVRTLLRWHNGIVIAAIDESGDVLGSFEICSERMIASAPVNETALLPVFWDYDDFPSSTSVYAVDLLNAGVVAIEPPTFSPDAERRQVATSFVRWLEDFFCQHGAIPDSMPILRTVSARDALRQTNVGVGPSDSSLTRLQPA